ncbi:MAG: isoprenylcysteine carboxylmethyltransferase family protein [Verrucomicrobia bacterium]|nr:isoprenylcysteine carboxylmethyltransferase family protein [Verrucomicrobiota bacterium]
MKSRGFIQHGGVWVAAQNGLTLAALLLAPLFQGQWNSAAISIFGVVLASVGGWFGIAGVRALGRNRTAYPKPMQSATLVQHGVYGRVRHPLYSSLMFASVGWALAWSSGAAVVAALSLAVLLDAKARVEERWLREKFPEYAAYSQRVRRFVPRIF